MNKHLLFIPFMAFLATSCGGGHITTTPVVKNAPSAVLNAPKRQAQQSQTNYTASRVDMGTLQWGTNPRYGFYAYAPSNITPVETNSQIGKLFCTLFNTDTYDRVYNATTNNTIALSIPVSGFPQGILAVRCDAYTDLQSFVNYVNGTFLTYHNNGTGSSIYDEAREAGYNEGEEEGYLIGYQEGEAHNNQIIQNGQYAGLTAFPRRHYLQILARRVVSGLEQLQAGHFDLIDTTGNYTIYIKWDYSYPKTTFQDYGNTIIGELYWTDIISGNWSTSWFGKYDPELHQIVSSPKWYATDEPIAMSFYPEVYLGSTIVGDVNLYFMGTANDYALGFADGQTYTIQASETYNNVFTIFTPAFRAVANFFNLNIGPFKIWYFFAIPLIVSLLILVLRLVKH